MYYKYLKYKIKYFNLLYGGNPKILKSLIDFNKNRGKDEENDDIENDIEYHIACTLKSNTTILNNTLIILLNIISKAKFIKMNDARTIKMLTFDEKIIEGHNYINKPGMEANLAKKFYELVKPNYTYTIDDITDFINLFDQSETKYKDSLHIMMGPIYSFIPDARDFIYKIVLHDTDLQTHIISVLKILYGLPETFTFDEFNEMIKDIDSNKNIYFDIIKYTTSKMSIHRRNLQNIEYNRKKIEGKDRIFTGFTDVDCYDGMLANSQAKGIVTGDSYYSVGNITKKIFKKYNRPYTTGISGSSLSFYNMVIDILKLNIDKRILPLLCIADYVPFYHSIAEILLTFSSEINLGYTIDKDPIDFIKNIMKDLDIHDEIE